MPPIMVDDPTPSMPGMRGPGRVTVAGAAADWLISGSSGIRPIARRIR